MKTKLFFTFFIGFLMGMFVVVGFNTLYPQEFEIRIIPIDLREAY